MPDLNTFLTRLLYSRLPQIGGSGGSASGVLTVSTTSAQTAADTNETDLWTYSLPANTLDVNGRTVRVTAYGSYGATANNKTVKLYFGAAVTSDSGTVAANGGNWKFVAEITRTGAATQIASALRVVGGFATGSGNSLTAPAETLSGALTIKVTGTNGTAAAGDIVFKGALVELLN